MYEDALLVCHGSIPRQRFISVYFNVFLEAGGGGKWNVGTYPLAHPLFVTCDLDESEWLWRYSLFGVSSIRPCTSALLRDMVMEEEPDARQKGSAGQFWQDPVDGR